METLKTVTKTELQDKADSWFKAQYFLIHDEFRRMKVGHATYAGKYYRDHRDEILAKRRQAKQKNIQNGAPRKARGRPKKYFADEEPAQPQTESNIEIVISN